MEEQMTIGVVPMSAKPYHKGHDMLIRIASKECDKVFVFVSETDRKRKGEITISGDAMMDIWLTYIEPSMPENVVVYYVTSPVAAVWEFVGEYNEEMSDDEFVIYSDETDVKLNFPPESMKKYWSFLYENGQIMLSGISRNDTVNISGTKMREFLSKGQFGAFKKYLPTQLKPYARDIYDTLLEQ